MKSDSVRRKTFSRRGIFLVDSVVAIALLTAIALVLIAGRQAATRATRAGNDRRAAMRLAEAYLAGARVRATTATTQATTQTTDVADGSPASEPAVIVTPLPTPAPAGWQWVSVRAEVNGHGGELVGLVRGRP